MFNFFGDARLLVVARRGAALLAFAVCSACISTPDAEIDSARGDEVVVRTGPFAGMTEADEVAREACGGQIALFGRETRDGDEENVFWRYRCVDREWERLKARVG